MSPLNEIRELNVEEAWVCLWFFVSDRVWSIQTSFQFSKCQYLDSRDNQIQSVERCIIQLNLGNDELPMGLPSYYEYSIQK